MGRSLVVLCVCVAVLFLLDAKGIKAPRVKILLALFIGVLAGFTAAVEIHAIQSQEQEVLNRLNPARVYPTQVIESFEPSYLTSTEVPQNMPASNVRKVRE